jgi:hypothetical protein
MAFFNNCPSLIVLPASASPQLRERLTKRSILLLMPAALNVQKKCFQTSMLYSLPGGVNSNQLSLF